MIPGAIDTSTGKLVLQVLEIIGIPLVPLLISVLLKSLAEDEDIKPEHGVLIGMDFAVLAAGACGGIFANPTLTSKWKLGLIVYGIFTLLLCILVLVVLALIRRRQKRKRWDEVTTKQAVFHVMLGALPLGLVTSILVIGWYI